MTSSSCKALGAVSVSLCSLLVSTQKAGLILQDWKKAQKRAFSSALEETNGRLSAPILALQNQENAYNLKNLPLPSPPSKKEKVLSRLFIEKVQESLRIPARADRSYFSP